MIQFKFLKNVFKPAKKFRLRKKKDAVGNLNEQKDLSGRFCTRPFEQYDIYKSGHAFSCCSSWLKLPLGNVKQSNPADLWNSEASQAIRASIFDGSFKYCDQKLCPNIQNNSLPTLTEMESDAHYGAIIKNKITALDDGPVFINFCSDHSCNLSCPSCRTQKILHSGGLLFEEQKAIHAKMVHAFLKEPTDRTFAINVTGSGDPFGSKIYREFLQDLNGADFPNLKIHLQTNGVMFTEKNWDKLHKIHNNLGNLIISLDAATGPTYDITRRGGNWDLLQNNLAFLSQRVAEGFFKYFRLDYVAQVDNFTEMPAFVELASRYNPHQIYFSLVTDWGTWSKEVYDEKCIWKENHPRFQEFLEVLKDPIFDNPKVDLGNLTHYREIALAAG